MQTTATIKQLNEALAHVNTLFDNNVVFKTDPEQISKNRTKFTLTVKDSKNAGGRIGHTGRRVKAACWHVHGEFFDFLFNDGVDYIKAGPTVMRESSDNWQDWNIGSMVQPMYYSEACDC